MMVDVEEKPGDNKDSQMPVLSLHDALALGEVELGLTTVAESDERQLEEIHRLPVLLRLLSASRPLSSVPSFWDDEEKEKSNISGDSGDKPNTATPIDELANQVVARLEDVAATYNVAEGVDVVACHLAPSICRNLSKIAPLKRKRRESSASASLMKQRGAPSLSVGSGPTNSAGATTSDGWETQELMLVGANPRSSISVKRRRLSKQPTTAATTDPKASLSAVKEKPADSADELNLGGDDGDGSAAGMLSEGGLGLSSEDEGNTTGKSKNRRGSEYSDSMTAVGAVDSQEELVSKTLSDLTALVALSLEPIKLEDPQDADINTTANSNNNNNNVDSMSKKGRLLLSVVDSALSEPFRAPSAGDSVRGIMTGSDLGSTVVALMHHAPVLRHQHVANALCRAALPQTVDLVKRLGANCPSAVPSLLRGCTDAYKGAVAVLGSRHTGISKTAKAAIQALAELSEREKSCVRSVLQQDGILIDLQLKFAISQDRLSAVCLLLQHLSSQRNDNEIPVQGPINAVRDELSLVSLLQQTPDLLISTVIFLKDQALTMTTEGEGLDQRIGWSCLLIRSWTWLVIQCDIMSTFQNSSRDALEAVVSLVSTLQALGEIIQGTPESDARTTEKPLTLLFCSSILTNARLSSGNSASDAVVQQCDAWIKNCFEYRSRHFEYGTVVARIACFLKSRDILSFREFVQNVLNNKGSSDRYSLDLPKELEQGVLRSWELIKDISNLDTFLKDKLAPSAPLNATALIDFVKFADLNANEDITETLRACLVEQIGGAANSSDQPDRKIPELIVRAAKYFANHATINLPLFSPLELEMSASKLDLRKFKGRLSGEDVDLMIFYKVLYWLAFVESGANSIFEFDMRVLPLKEMLSFSRRLPSTPLQDMSSLASYLEYFVSKHCPEVIVNLEKWELVKNLRITSTATRTMQLDRMSVKRQLSATLKAALSRDAKNLPVPAAERAFILARGLLSDADLCTQVISTLLAAPNSPPPFCTYSSLYRDPLVLLKAPMHTWRYGGLRRVALSVTATLLEANDAVSPSVGSTDELIAARNLLLVRGLLATVSGSEDGNSDNTPHLCSMTTNLLRRLIATNRGLMGVLVKQQNPALPDAANDWLVEFVPETFDDASCLVSVFSERGSVTARLSAAAAIIRIAIAHGHRDEEVAERLVYSALAQLISSFFLVLGPVGVPVNVLVGEGALDITQTSRQATFRILRSLVNVRGRQRSRLRNECGMALHKIKMSGLSKDQSALSGVAGAVVNKRKALLREIAEEIAKAASAMGSGIDL